MVGRGRVAQFERRPSYEAVTQPRRGSAAALGADPTAGLSENSVSRLLTRERYFVIFDPMQTQLVAATLWMPLFGAVLGVLAPPLAGKRLLPGLAMLTLAVAVALVVRVTLGAAHPEPGPWGLAVSADRLGALVVLLASGIQATVLAYATRCLDDEAFRRFSVWSQVLVAATDLIGIAATPGWLVLGWVVASLAVFGLVAGTGGSAGAARRVAAGLLLGDAALVGAVIILWRLVGDPSLFHLGAAEARLRAARLALGPVRLSAADAVALLIVLAAIVRGALWPGPRWLPATLAAPTPVSALLHAGVVNAGGFLLIRLSPLLGATPVASGVALVAGLATAAFGGVAAAVRPDIKGSLVYSTMSQMGFMVAECAVGAFAAAVFHLVAHGMYKAALFLGSGDGIDQQVRQRRFALPRTPLPVRLWVASAFTLAFGFLVVAVLRHPAWLVHRGGVVTIAFTAVTSGSLLWGWLERRPASAQAVWGGLGAAILGAGYLWWSSAVTGWLAPQLPLAGAAFRSPLWLLAALIAAGGLAVAVVWLGRSSALTTRLRARALWAAWEQPSRLWGTPRFQAWRWLEVQSWKQPI